MKLLLVFFAIVAIVYGAQLYAGVSTVDATAPVGAPLAGYNHGERRVKKWPIPHFTKYTTFMSPSVGVDMPLWAKCLVLSDGTNKVAFATIDAIGADGGVFNKAYEIAKAQGFSIPYDNVILSGSHSHSGAGAVSNALLWELAPATDLVKPELQLQFATYIAGCLVEAELRLQPAQIGLGTTDLFNATRNRRANFSPYVTPTTVDTQLGLIKIDDMNGKPLATLWNFAIHGTCLGASQMKFHGDCMGVANSLIEHDIGGVALFVNSDAGDIAPAHCENWLSSHMIVDAVARLRQEIKVTDQVDELVATSKIVDFGPTHMNLTLQRLANCTHGGYLDICTFCSSKFLNCDWDARLKENWIDEKPKFTAIRIKVQGKNTLLVTVPGEPIQALGNLIKQDAKAMGYDQCFVLGYSNTHMGYFTTPEEYEVGGYEGFMTFWGVHTSEIVRGGCAAVANAVRP